MNKRENIIYNHTLDEYNKKYRTRRNKLLKIKKIDAENNHSLLDKKKWWFINDTYYQIPKTFTFTWFRNLNALIQIGTCVLIAGAVATAITVPVIMYINRIELVLDTNTLDVIEDVKFNEIGDQYVATLKAKDPTKLLAVADIKNNDKSLILDTNYTYSMDTQELAINKKGLRGKVVISISSEEKHWFNDKEYINSLTSSDIGTIKLVKVNGLKHKVRLIGIDHDSDENDAKIHTTWEFENIICGDDGNSLGYQWHDTNDSEHANYDYLNSSIRKALTGQGDFNSTIYCATKSSQDQWDKNYTNKLVINMLEPGLKCAIKKVSREVRVGETKSEVVGFKDRLFMLSTKEIGWKDELTSTGTLYPFYEGAIRETYIKKQINNDVIYMEQSEIKTDETIWKGHIVYNAAGFNRALDNTGGGYYWLGTPRSDYFQNAHYSDSLGNIQNINTYIKAYGVAPAFCL